VTEKTIRLKEAETCIEKFIGHWEVLRDICYLVKCFRF